MNKGKFLASRTFLFKSDGDAVRYLSPRPTKREEKERETRRLPFSSVGTSMVGQPKKDAAVASPTYQQISSRRRIAEAPFSFLVKKENKKKIREKQNENEILISSFSSFSQRFSAFSRLFFPCTLADISA